jgi:N-hydroxyarylamine O-acetyltransferase
MNLDAYLSRIQLEKTPIVDRETLIALHRQHILNIPFEDLDIFEKVPLSLGLDALFEKIILKKRGGFCYELNTLFYHLLNTLGFSARLVSCQISQGDGKFGPPYDHMAILVDLEETWLVDVGYGDLFVEPLSLQAQGIQQDWFKYFMIEQEGDHFLLSESRNGKRFTPRYRINPSPERITAFEPQLRWKESHPDSYFVKNRVCSLPNPQGRTTLFNDYLIITSSGKRAKEKIHNTTILKQHLNTYFGIALH